MLISSMDLAEETNARESECARLKGCSGQAGASCNRRGGGAK